MKYLIIAVLFTWFPDSRGEPVKNFAGRWETTYGLMELQQKGSVISGSYLMNGEKCAIDGRLENGKFTFKYKEPKASGQGWFELGSGSEKFIGTWKQDGTNTWAPWVGVRIPDYASLAAGVWATPYGRLRIIEKSKDVRIGVFANGGAATLTNVALLNDGLEISGDWKGQELRKFTGTRLKPIPGKVWLMVMEAHWESSLEDREYAFGDMLKAFFDRTPNVEVRRRPFSDSRSLKRWLDELAFIPEPIVVTIASHGQSDGLWVDGANIPASVVTEGLKYAASLKALHFSSCLVMKGKFGQDIFKQLSKDGNKVAVSGYKNSVDWAASALFEMNYFDLILSRGLAPPEASQAALVMFPIAGDRPLKNVPVAPGGFSVIF